MTYYLDNATELIINWLPAVIILAIAAPLFYFLGIQLILRTAKRLWQRQPTWMYKEQEKLLSLTPLVELLAPTSEYINNLEKDKKRPFKPAFLTPWQRAVKRSYQTHRPPRNAWFDAPKQIRDAAKATIVRRLNEIEAKQIPEYSQREHYVIELNYSGLDPADFEKLYPKIKSQLALTELIEIGRSNIVLILRASKIQVEDILIRYKNTGSWFAEHPAQNWKKFPLGTTENGGIYELPLHHTLISGLTGSGKSSPLLGVITQLAPFKSDGLVKFFGIDPKNDALRKVRPLLEKYTDDTDQACAIIAEVHSEMNKRKRGVDSTNHPAHKIPSPENPITILLIDELLSLLLEPELKQSSPTFKKLSQILAQGRSLGVFVIGATQSNDKNLFGTMRGNFANAVVLRQDSKYFNDLFLGDGAAEKGFDATSIPVANEANGYRYAGIGYVKQDAGQPVKLRFTATTDEDIAALVAKYGSSTATPIHIDLDYYGLPHWILEA